MGNDSAGLVLYVGRDASGGEACPGSRRCLALVDAQCIPCTVQHVENLYEAGVEIPDWLDGTPVLVDAATRQAFKGSKAVAFLEGAARASAEAEAAAAAEAEAEAEAARAAVATAGRAARAARAAGAAAAAPAPRAAAPRAAAPPAALGEGGESDESDEGDKADAWGRTLSTGAGAGLGSRPGQGPPPPTPNEPSRDGKVTEDEVQRYIEARNRPQCG